MALNYSALAKAFINLGYCKNCAYAITTRYPVSNLCDNCKIKLEMDKKKLKIMENSYDKK